LVGASGGEDGVVGVPALEPPEHAHASSARQMNKRFMATFRTM
jgi:hypothetical protein